MTYLDKDQALAALKDAMNNQPTYDALEIIAALPAIPLDDGELLKAAKAYEGLIECQDPRAEDTNGNWELADGSWAHCPGCVACRLRDAILNSGALPVLETMQRESAVHRDDLIEDLELELSATKHLLALAEEVAEARRYETDCAVGFALQRDAARAELAELRASVPVLETPASDDYRTAHRKITADYRVGNITGQEALTRYRRLEATLLESAPVEPVPAPRQFDYETLNMLLNDSFDHAPPWERMFRTSPHEYASECMERLIQKILAFYAAVPAPRLEWVDWGRSFESLDMAGEDTPWSLHRGREGTLGEDTWTLMCGDTILMLCPDIEYLKDKAEKLQAVLSPPVGTQP